MKTRKILLLTSVIASSYLFAEDTLTVEKIAKDSNDYIERNLFVEPEKKFYEYVVKDNSIYVNFLTDENKDLMSKIDFTPNGENSFSYNGKFFHKLQSEDQDIKEIMEKFKQFQYSGNIKTIDGTYVYDFVMKQDDTINFISGEDDSLTLNPYSFKIEVDNNKSTINWDFIFKKFEMNFTDEMYNNFLYIDDVKSKGDMFNSKTEIKEISVNNYDKHKDVNKNTLPTEYFLLKDLKMESKLEKLIELNQNKIIGETKVSKISFNNPLMNNQKTEIKNLFFDINYTITNKVDLHKLYNLHGVSQVEQMQLLQEVISNPLSLHFGFGFDENNFKNDFKMNMSSSKIYMDKIMSNEPMLTGEFKISDYAENFKLNIEINISPLYAGFLMIAPPDVQKFIVKNEDSSVTIKLDENQLESFLNEKINESQAVIQQN